jgi:two-component system response regulator VicR
VAGKGKKILCIEDNPEMIDLVDLILARRGYEVIGAVGGQEGIETIQREKPDLILLDLMMPEVDGSDVFHWMQKNAESRHIPVVVVTAKTAPIDKVLWLNVAKVDGFVTKPFGPKELEDVVEKVLRVKETGEAREGERWDD